ncbi:MAG: NTP transferase domain-containing protein [Planctomycetes bacterium]|nr:NTP transferase domain-containing protein [Planctomycetota bacterium]MCL4730844.1 NTP transferase domain-containing protein [Planctomycetota bacterium]
MTPGATAVILAGGGATRMGGEKALRSLRGRSLLQIALDTARAVCDELVVATGTREFALPPGVMAAPDAPEHLGAGPLAGVAAGLAAASRPRVLVLACDLPHVTPALARALLVALDHADAAWCRHDADEPLLAALKRDAARAAVDAALRAGRHKVIPVWQSLNACVITGAELAALGDPAWLFANVNTPADLESA